MRFFIAVILLALSMVHSAEMLRPVYSPENSVLVGAGAVLDDDVYSLDVVASGEWAFCECFSVYGDVSYRTLSYEFDTMWHDQIHEKVNLHVNGFNSALFGFKYFPISYAGIGMHFRTPPGSGDLKDHSRLGIEGVGVYPFSDQMKLGASIEYLENLDEDDFEWGDEIGAKLSIVWKVDLWRVQNVFLYRHRLTESRNLSMDENFQKMDDLYGGLKLRWSVARYWMVSKVPVGIEIAYEMSRGNLFGFETGHRIDLFLRIADF